MDTLTTIVFCTTLFIVGSLIYYLILEGIIYIICKLPDWIVGSIFIGYLLNVIFEMLKNLKDKK
jgi:hypothetical protein